MSTYITSDLHGQLDLYNMMNEWIKSEDKIICLGDCGDRGPEGWETIKAVYNNPQWEYYMGNHEHMLLHAMYEYFAFSSNSTIPFKPYYEDALGTLRYNGGYPTYVGWIKDGADPSWVDKISKLPYMGHYTNKDKNIIIFSHAGCTPLFSTSNDKFQLIWDRSHIDDEYSSTWRNCVIIHGHTPCSYIDKNWTPMDGALYYANNRKICIDMKSFKTKTACLLNLDTFDEQIFMIH